MSALRDKYAIVGTGKSRLGQVGANSLALLEEAIKNALDEAGLTNKDVDGVVVRGPDDVYSHHQLVAARLGVDANFSTSASTTAAPARSCRSSLPSWRSKPASRPRLCAATDATPGRAPTPRAAWDLRKMT